MAKEKNRNDQRPKLSKEEIDARNKARLVERRVEAIPLLGEFINRATRSEVESLIDFVNAKNAAGRDMDKRMTHAKALSLSSPEAINIMTALPAIDIVMKESLTHAMNALSSRDVTFDVLVANYRNFQSKVVEAVDILLPLVDSACENGLVRDRQIVDDFRARKIVQEMIELGINPTAADAHAQLKIMKTPVKKDPPVEGKVAKEPIVATVGESLKEVEKKLEKKAS